MSRRPLLVVAVGGNALSSPAAPADVALSSERTAAARTGHELAALAARGYRLLVVHGNGPQVGRLLRSDADAGALDIHVAQTQGELGYLLAAALETASGEATAALVTRVLVDPRDPRGSDPEKPIGPVLKERPAGPALTMADGTGWRRLVPSPWPCRILEASSLRRLLEDVHLVAGGGGGVPVTAEGAPVAGVVDKDRVAALLATELAADALLIATDVDGAYRDFAQPAQALIPAMDVTTARRLLAADQFAPGSMAPKVASAAEFAAVTGRAAVICRLGDLLSGLDGQNGTRITADRRAGA